MPVQRSTGDFEKEVPIMFRLIRICPRCRAKIMLRVRVGKRVMCPECKSMFMVAEAA
jgi:DNA-directed RNA polymerase subunit RPC12/RpoP